MSQLTVLPELSKIQLLKNREMMITRVRILLLEQENVVKNVDYKKIQFEKNVCLSTEQYQIYYQYLSKTSLTIAEKQVKYQYLKQVIYQYLKHSKIIV